MKKTIAVISLSLSLIGIVFAETNTSFNLSANASSNSESAEIKLLDQKAYEKIKKLIISHPDPLVNTRLLDLIKTGKVLFAANDFLPEMSSSLEQNGGKEQVFLWYNFRFILDVAEITNPADKNDYLLLALYHEAVHIDDHFNGKYKLIPLISNKVESEELTAQKIWDMEWSAVSKEWGFAKKIKKPYLVPVIYEATRKGETPETFLYGFYQLQTTGNAVQLNKDLLKGFSTRYSLEKGKLVSKP